MALCLLACTFLSLCAAQSILTAPSFFQTVSAEYAKIQDYEASVDIQASKTSMEGKVSFKRPNLLRIDFSNPEAVKNSPEMQNISYKGKQYDLSTKISPDNNLSQNQPVNG